MNQLKSVSRRRLTAIISSAKARCTSEASSARPIALILDRHDMGKILQTNGRYADASLESAEDPLPYYFRHYLELVDWTSRTVREDKKGVGFDE